MRGSERLSYSLKHAFGIAQYVVVPESQDAIACNLEEGRASIILGTIAMLAAVGLDDQPGLMTDEVGDERPNGLLSSELGAVELARPQQAPQGPFRIGQVTAQPLSSIECRTVITPHPPRLGSLGPSLSLKGRGLIHRADGTPSPLEGEGWGEG